MSFVRHPVPRWLQRKVSLSSQGLLDFPRTEKTEHGCVQRRNGAFSPLHPRHLQICSLQLTPLQSACRRKKKKIYWLNQRWQQASCCRKLLSKQPCDQASTVPIFAKQGWGQNKLLKIISKVIFTAQIRKRDNVTFLRKLTLWPRMYIAKTVTHCEFPPYHNVYCKTRGSIKPYEKHAFLSASLTWQGQRSNLLRYLVLQRIGKEGGS